MQNNPRDARQTGQSRRNRPTQEAIKIQSSHHRDFLVMRLQYRRRARKTVARAVRPQCAPRMAAPRSPWSNRANSSAVYAWSSTEGMPRDAETSTTGSRMPTVVNAQSRMCYQLMLLGSRGTEKFMGSAWELKEHGAFSLPLQSGFTCFGTNM